ncbi:MAG: hypothetical protein V3W31_07050, partial [Thermodesulfobacteriota bacterium]
TPTALEKLKLKGFLSLEDFNVLSDAYAFYRLLETRLRIVHDRPEGVLQKGSHELASLARRVWGENVDGKGEKLLDEYLGYAEKVRGIYERVMEG